MLVKTTAKWSEPNDKQASNYGNTMKRGKTVGYMYRQKLVRVD